MSLWEHYYLAKDVQDALQCYAAAEGKACWVSGGTDLLLDLQQGRRPPVGTLIDLSSIAELNTLEVRPEALFVGAAVPLNRILASPAVALHANALHEAAGLIGGPQVRNTATLGGNVAHALPAGDGTIALLALEARVEIASLVGRRFLPIEKLFLGPGKSIFDESNELLVGFHLPLKTVGEGSAHRRVMRPQGVAIAILNLAAWLKIEEGKIGAIRLACGPAGPIPCRLRSAENILSGRQPDDSALQAAIQAALREVHLRTSPHRATQAYRERLLGELLHTAVQAAWRAAQFHEQS